MHSVRRSLYGCRWCPCVSCDTTIVCRAAFAFLYLVYFHTRQLLVVLSWSTSPQNTSFQQEWGNVGEKEVVP